MPPKTSHKRALSSGEVPAAKKANPKQPAKPSWIYVITRTSTESNSPVEEFQIMSVCETLQDANFKVKHLQREDDDYELYKEGRNDDGESAWQETRDENGCLRISADDEEGAGVDYKVVRMPLTKAGTVDEPYKSESDGEEDAESEDSEEGDPDDDEEEEEEEEEIGRAYNTLPPLLDLSRGGGGRKVNCRGTGCGNSRCTSCGDF